MSSSTTEKVADKLPSKEELKEDVKKATKSSVQSLRALVAGGVGGVFAVVVGHPFDLVKVRMQTAEKGVYNGAMDVLRKGIAKDGLVRGLYAGVSAPLVGVTPMFAVSFWGYDLGKQLVTSVSTVENGQFSVAQVSAAGFFSAIPQTLITAPFERVKVLLQIQGQKNLAPGEKHKYNGGVDVVRQLYKEGGIRSVYRGSAMTLARDGPGSAFYFATYETVKRKLTPKDPVTGLPGQLSMPAVMAAGGAAGIAMWIPVFPIDTIKSRLQSAEGRPTISGTIKGIYANGGYKAFFPGIGPAMARAVPANAATFAGVELAQKAMRKMFDKDGD
ncbi:carnitine transporter [Ascochyta rabiei]|uniref:Transmembrane transport n=1 Tax=Didymella rabiei TaxID=5454 RepID=A0A163HR12_DIDRA|nr:carnitine transporter [Ascochyta rabiei]KZM25420.1 transmembrane transport [Ascochyta rabiei]UPX09837.1 carnitine transporter [Ascochyta rabiei]